MLLLNQKIDCISADDIIHSAYPGTSMSKLKAVLSERQGIPEDLIVLFLKTETSITRCTGAYIEDLFFNETADKNRKEIDFELILQSFHPLMQSLCARHHIPYLKNIRLKTLTGERLIPVTPSLKRDLNKNAAKDLRYVKDLIEYLSENLGIPPWNQRFFSQQKLLRNSNKGLVELYLEQQNNKHSDELVLCLAIEPPRSVRITMQIPFADDQRNIDTELEILETTRMVDVKEHVKNLTGTPAHQVEVYSMEDLDQTRMYGDQESIWQIGVASFRIEKLVHVCINEQNNGQNSSIFQRRYTILNYDTETVRRLKRRLQMEPDLLEKNFYLVTKMMISENTLLKNINETIYFQLVDKEICRIS